VRIFFTSLMAFFLSAFAGGMVAQVLAVKTGAGEEYILVFMAVVVVTTVATLVFFIAQFFGNTVKAVNIVAVVLIVLLGLTLAGVAAWTIMQSPAHQASQGDMSIIAGLFLPNLVTVVVHWLFVRWRLRRRPDAATPRFGRGPEPA
jgi:cytochrome c biogenesis protein CcdA